MKHSLRKLSSLLLLMAGAACGGDAITNSPLPNGSVSARVDGQQWTATLSVQVNHANSILAFGASGDGITIGMAMPTATGPATHVIGPGSPANANLTDGAVTWAATPAIGGGTITLTSLTSTRATGTFSFTAESSSGTASPATRQVTQGMFDLTF